MRSNKIFEHFPAWMVIAADTVPLSIYFIGAYVMFTSGTLWGVLYLFYCLFFETRIMRFSCVHCYYYGKLCGLGKGKLAALFFKKGSPQRFLEKKITWKDLIPDLLVSLVPFIIGVYLLVKDLSWIMLFLIVSLFLLTTFGNGFIRGNIVCKYCKQRALGCPAEKFFAQK
jgi:hypothetical protein